jgi:hypothetical protein
VLTARSEAEVYVEAADARRGVSYLCRQCGAPVIFKPGRVRAAHFAHRPDGACTFGGPMSAAHLAAQSLIAAALRARGLEVELEAPLAGATGDRRVDVLTWPPGRTGARVAIEVQASAIGADMIEARTASYQAAGVAPLWLRLLDFSGFRAVQTLPFRGTVWIEGYRAKAWERWAHDHLGGRLWFMDSGAGRLWRGLFVTAHRSRERALMRGEGGEASARGADWTAASQWVDLELDGPFTLAEVKLGQGPAAGPDGRPRRFAWFAPAGEEAVRPPFAPPLRVDFRAQRIGQSRELQCYVGGAWMTATTEGARSDWRTHRSSARPVLRPL